MKKIPRQKMRSLQISIKTEHLTTRLQTPFEFCKPSSDFANPLSQNANPEF